MRVVARVPQVACDGREQPIELQLRVGLRVRNRHALSAKPWGRQRYQQACGTRAAGRQIGQSLIDKVATGQRKIGEPARSESSAHPARRGRAARYLRSASGIEVPGTRTATCAPQRLVALANILRQVHAYNNTAHSNAPLAAYREVCPSIIHVDTPGSTAAAMTRFHFHHRRRPMYPFEPDLHWSP